MYARPIIFTLLMLFFLALFAGCAHTGAGEPLTAAHTRHLATWARATEQCYGPEGRRTQLMWQTIRQVRHRYPDDGYFWEAKAELAGAQYDCEAVDAGYRPELERLAAWRDNYGPGPVKNTKNTSDTRGTWRNPVVVRRL